MARHQGAYKQSKKHIYWELSRSKIELFRRCKACFWLEKVAGIKAIDFPSFNLNTNTDILLKKDFDRYRGKKESHPFLIHHGLDYLSPYDFPEHWTDSIHFGSTGRFHVNHEPSRIKFGGGVDDIYENTETGELHIIDYKSTANLKANPERVTLDGKWKEGYKRQMDMYVWILEQMGYPASKTGYFLYVDGLHVVYDRMIDDDPDFATMKFQTTWLEYETDTSWVEPALMEIKDFVVNTKVCPPHAEDCDVGRWLRMVEHKEYHAAENRAL